MTEFATARRNMVEGQVRTADVTDLRILSAMLEIPRENFVPAAAAGLAYLDLDLAVGEAGSRRLLKPKGTFNRWGHSGCAADHKLYESSL